MDLGDGRAHLQSGVDLPRIVRIQLLTAPFHARGEADVARPGVAERTGQLRVDTLQFRLGRAQRGYVDSIEHRLRRGRGIQQVVAAGGQRIGQRPAIGEAARYRFPLAAARAECTRFPVPSSGAAAHTEQATVGLRTIGLDRAAEVEERVLDRYRPAIGVVGIAGRQVGGHRLGQPGICIERETAAFQGEERAAAEPGNTLDFAVQDFAERFDGVAEAEGAVGICLPPLGGRNQRGIRRLVEAAGIAGQAIDRCAGHPRGALRAVSLRIQHRHRYAVHQVPRALGRPAVPAPAGLVAVDAGRRQVALVLVQPVTVVAFQADQDVVAITVQVAQAADELELVFVQAALVGSAGAGAELRALEILAGDDVDHTGNGIRTVHRRCSILQHLDALHGDQRQGVEIDEGVGKTVGRETVVGQPAAIEQHQGVLLRKAAQADPGRTRCPATVGGFVGGIAGIGGKGAKHVGHGRFSGGVQLFAVDHLHRIGGFGIAALDVGAGDTYGRQRAGIARGGGGSGGLGGGGQRRGQGGGKSRHEQGVLGHVVIVGVGGGGSAVAHERSLPDQ